MQPLRLLRLRGKMQKAIHMVSEGATMAINEQDRMALTAQAQDQDQAELAQLRAALSANEPPHLVSANGEPVILPDIMRQLMLFAIAQMEHGKNVIITPLDDMLTTQEAADLMNVSRPYLIKLLEKGEIPFTMVGTHRRLLRDDVLRYDEVEHARMRAGLEEIARLSQEAGAYD